MMDSNFQFQALLFWWLVSRGECFSCKQQSLLLVIVTGNSRFLSLFTLPRVRPRAGSLQTFLSQSCKTSVKISAVCTGIAVCPFIPEPWNKRTISRDEHLKRGDKLWANLHLSITVSFVVPSVMCKELLSKHISMNSMRDNDFFSAHARLIGISLSSFLFCEDRASDPEGKSYEAAGLIVLFNGSVITISPWLAMRTNYW